MSDLGLPPLPPAPEDEDKVVGDYYKEPSTQSGWRKLFAAGTGGTTQPYRDSDISRPPEDIARTQRQMADAGILKGKYQYGVWDQATRNAYEDVLAVANARGVSWQKALDEWQANERDTDGEEARQGRTKVIQLPNANRLRQNTDELAQSLLGRRLSEAERERYVQDAIINARREQEAEYASEDRTRNPGAADETIVREELDPMADLEARIKQQYSGEYGAHEIAQAGSQFFRMLGGE